MGGLAHEPPRLAPSRAACDVSLEAIDSYRIVRRAPSVKVFSVLFSHSASTVLSLVKMRQRPHQHRLGLDRPKAIVNATGCAAYHIPYLHQALIGVPPQPRCILYRNGYRYRYRHQPHPQHACKCVADLPALNGRDQPSQQPIRLQHPAPSPSVPAVSRASLGHD
jgi:hypothetical protein